MDAIAKKPIPDLAPRRRHHTPRTLIPIEKNSGATRFFDKMVREIEADLGGRRELTRIERELVHAFAGAATAARYQTHQILLGEISEINLSGFATIASTMLRIGGRLGLSRRAKLVGEPIDDVPNEEAGDAAE